MNQLTMNYFQNEINLSTKIIKNEFDSTFKPNSSFVTYKKYSNIYNYAELKNEGIFDNSNIYEKIKNNIN